MHPEHGVIEQLWAELREARSEVHGVRDAVINIRDRGARVWMRGS